MMIIISTSSNLKQNKFLNIIIWSNSPLNAGYLQFQISIRIACVEKLIELLHSNLMEMIWYFIGWKRKNWKQK